MAADDVPAGLARLWRVPTTARLGRPAELDVDRVVRTAVELADRDGLDGVTLAKVAKVLGYTGMSLYRHVGSKDELFILMGDCANEHPPDVGSDAGQWRSGLRTWTLALLAAHLRHPWLAELPFSGPPSGPNAIGWMDAALRALRDTGLDWGAKVRVQIVLSGYVRYMSLAARQFEQGERDTGLDQVQVEQNYGRALVRLVDPERFPEAAKLFASATFEPPPENESEHDLTHADGTPVDADFVFGLELILDGVAASIDAAAEQDSRAQVTPQR